MGLLGGIARTALAAATWTAVSNTVSRRQAGRWAGEDQSQHQQGYMPPPPGRYQRPMFQPPPPAVVQAAPSEQQFVATRTRQLPADMSARLAQLQQLGTLR